jgi:hypothetical protein
MAGPQGSSIPDALVWRQNADGTAWEVRCIKAHRLAVYLEGGWHVLITEAQIKAADLDETYRADRDRPFNPPRPQK